MKRGWLWLVVLAVAGVSGLAIVRRDPGPLRAGIVAAAAPLDATGFARAEGPTSLIFPRDHGPHDDFRAEWWYYTGNLTAAGGEHFGFQLTFFRRALLPRAEREPRPSSWAAEQVYMAHFALTDVTGREHIAYEKLGRGSARLAGAQAEPYRVWLEDWSAEALPGGDVRLHAKAGDAVIDLVLRDKKGPALQGDRGYSRKGPEPGNASYYVSLTRLAVEGSATVGDRSFEVTGRSWMDHEWSTSVLGPQQVGWDWFSIQLDNGWDLMLYLLRGGDGSVDPFSGGALIAPDGSLRALDADDAAVVVAEWWRSPHTGGLYPASWTLAVPSAGLRLEITPYIADQEVRLSYTYWEGAVRVTGTHGGSAVTGDGYVELTGYAGTMAGQF